jgi:hypothetical protein
MKNFLLGGYYCTDLATELLEECIVTQANAMERSF